jgi:hypothetical protein
VEQLRCELIGIVAKPAVGQAGVATAVGDVIRGLFSPLVDCGDDVHRLKTLDK